MENLVTHQIEVPKDKSEITESILHSVKASILEASSQQLEAIFEALQPKVVNPQNLALAKEIAGDDYSEGNLALLELANLKRYYQRRRDLLANSITTPQVVELIGCQAVTTVHDRRKTSRLLGLKDNGVYKFPLWQFDPEGDDGVIDGLSYVLKALQISDFAKLNWFNLPLRCFANRTPIQVMKSPQAGNIKDLVIEARGIGVAQ